MHELTSTTPTHKHHSNTFEKLRVVVFNFLDESEWNLYEPYNFIQNRVLKNVGRQIQFGPRAALGADPALRKGKTA